MTVKNSKKLIMIIGIAIILIFGIFFIKNLKKEKSQDYSNMTDEEIDIAIQEKVDKMKLKDLSGLGERDRMEYYVSSFIKAIEAKKYEEAYEMLYDDFKNNYFQKLSDFEEYAKTKFPSMPSLEYTNIERNGDIYVLWVTLSDPLLGRETEKEMNFVVKENDLNDFDLSFTVN